MTDRANEKIWVAASVGPYGAVLGGGQEYEGNYAISKKDLVSMKHGVQLLSTPF